MRVVAGRLGLGQLMTRRRSWRPPCRRSRPGGEWERIAPRPMASAKRRWHFRSSASLERDFRKKKLEETVFMILEQVESCSPLEKTLSVTFRCEQCVPWCCERLSI